MRVLILLAAAWGAGGASAGVIPPPPDDGYIADYAQLLPAHTRPHIAAMQQEALQNYNTPIVVVTIMRMADYDGRVIEILARKWFDAWRIGTLDRGRGGANKGILVLIAVLDRAARIELGADWGTRANAYAERVMNERMTPLFKSGKYVAGIERGLEDLLELAKAGPTQPPPGSAMNELLGRLSGLSLLPGNLLPVGVGIALVLFVLAYFVRDARRAFVAVGLFVLVFTFFSLLAVAAAFFLLARHLPKGRRRSRWERDSWSSSSSSSASSSSSSSCRDGFSGGFSGGGGATGRW